MSIIFLGEIALMSRKTDFLVNTQEDRNILLSRENITLYSF